MESDSPEGREGDKNAGVGGVMEAAWVSHYHTSEEKPRLQIQEDRVLCLLFYKRKRRQRGGMQLYSGAADGLSPRRCIN